MAHLHFYGTVKGKAGEASRLGSKESELRTRACSWDGAIEVVLFHHPSGRDKYQVRMQQHGSSRGWEGTIDEGYLGEQPTHTQQPAYWRDVAAFAQHLAVGFENASADAAKINRCDEHFNGRLGVYEKLARLAEGIALVWRDDKRDRPGVFGYEVLEPLGEWFLDNWSVGDSAFLAHFMLEYEKFMGQGVPA